MCRERGAKRPRQSQTKVSIRRLLVEPGLPNGTPAVISNVSPRLAMPWAWAISSAVETTSSTWRKRSLTTECTPQATVKRRAVTRFGVRLRIGARGRSRAARRVEAPDSL
ncbi:hypothetical protein D3C75_1190900 [compost metagenome]